MPLAESDRTQSSFWTAIAGYSILPAIGLACFRLPAWVMFRSDIGYLGDNVAFISHLIQNLAIILFVIMDFRTCYDERSLLRWLQLATCLVLLGSGLFAFSSHRMLYSYIGCAISGAASTVPLLVWGYYFCSVNPGKSAFELTLAFAIYGVATQVFATMPAVWTTTLMMTAPVVSYLCLRASILRSNGHIPAEPRLSFRGLLRALPWRICLLLFLCMVSNVLAKLLVPTDATLLTSSYRLVWPAIFIAIFALYCVWLFVLHRDDIEKLWPVFALIVFSGLLCFSSFNLVQPSFAQSFLRSTQECLMLFCWLVTASITYRRKLPRIAVFGCMTLVFVKPPTIVTTVLFLGVPSDVSTQAGSTAVVVAAAMALILVVATLLIATADNRRAPKTTAPVQASPALSALSGGGREKVVESLRAGYNLTQREIEVGILLARGYTMKQVAEMLCVSLDTVRAHSKGLYRKLNIHHKQDLIAIVERECRSGEQERCAESGRRSPADDLLPDSVQERDSPLRGAREIPATGHGRRRYRRESPWRC